MAVLVAGQRGDVFIPDEQFPWNSLAEQTLTMAVSLEVLRWLAVWLLAVSAVAFARPSPPNSRNARRKARCV